MVDGNWIPIGFFSTKLKPSQSRYSTYDRELLAIYLAIKFFKHLVDGRRFIIKTDHKPLIFAFKQKNDKASPRQLRHLDYISQFSTEILHVAGSENIVADALSRLNQIGMPTILDSKAIAKAQEKDDELQDILKGNSSLKLQKLHINEDTSLYCDVATGHIRPYIPSTLRRRVFNSVNVLSHPSGRSTSQQLKQKYVWPGFKKDILAWSRSCLPCQRAKIQRHTHTIPNKIGIPEQRFEHVHLDLIVLPVCQEYRYCLTMIDRFTRWPEAVPLKDMTTEAVATAFYVHWIARFGTPQTITTDQGTQFESSLFNALAKLIGAKRIHTTPYHPASNGIIERWHRTLKASLMCQDQTPWVDLLPTVLLGLRTCYKEDLKASVA